MTSRQLNFLQLYLDKSSATYSNALQSALAAGYSQQYAEKITTAMPQWLSENVGNDEYITVREIVEGIKAETRANKSSDRLKAWELLGKFKGVFTHKIEVKANVEHATLTPEMIEIGDRILAQHMAHLAKRQHIPASLKD